MKRYSIILRAYNAEKCISKSIESVLNQKYNNWELLIVNDGSTDCTAEICDEYAKKDNRIKVIHQENKGCLLATQTGIAYATGDYVCLIDSDDWYDSEYLEIVNNIVISEAVDMVVVNYQIVFSDENVKEIRLVESERTLNTKDSIKVFLETTNYALWNKVVAREKIVYKKEEQEFFDTAGKSTNLGDDLLLLMPVLCGCENIYFSSKCLYNYVMCEESISHKKAKDNWMEVFIRNRLMHKTYQAIECRTYMDEEIIQLIQHDTLALMFPNVLEIVKRNQINKKIMLDLRDNWFYKNIVKKKKFWDVKKAFGKKRALAFLILKYRIQVCI